MEVKVPFGGEFIRAEIPEDNVVGVFQGRDMPSLENFTDKLSEEINRALVKLKAKKDIKEGTKVTVVVTDRTRPTPNHLILPVLVDELSECGVRHQDITILSGLGMHAPDSEKDFIENISPEVAGRVNWENHDPDSPTLLDKGRTPLGTDLQFNHKYLEADVRIVTGNVAPCMLSGFSGGGKTVLPGVAARETIYKNHRLFVDALEALDRGSLLGALPPINTVREDIEEAASLSGLDFAINTVLNTKNEVSRFYVGEHKAIHRKAVEYMTNYIGVDFPEPADVVIGGTGDAKYEVSLFQGGSRVLGVLEPVLKKKGTLILVNECREGICEGTDWQLFQDWMEKMPTPEEIFAAVRKEELDPVNGCIVMTFSWFIHKLEAQIILVSTGMDPQQIKNIHLTPASSLEEAVSMAMAKHGRDAKVSVVPRAALIQPHCCF